MYCRISAEIGADVVKCIYPGSLPALTEVVVACPVPLLLAGGSKAQQPELAYEKAQIAMDAGAAGLVFGRNVFEAADPAAEVARFRQIIHRE
jgi:class I fructose-bisphosphate aldolase